MQGTLPEARTEHDISLRALAALIGVSHATVISRLRGNTQWTLTEARTIAAHLQSLDPTLTLDDLFGLEPLPPSPDLPQLSDEPIDSGDSEPQLAEVTG